MNWCIYGTLTGKEASNHTTSTSSTTTLTFWSDQVIKLSKPEMTRTPEPEILRKLETILDDKVKGHISVLLSSQIPPVLNTGLIRKRLHAVCSLNELRREATRGYSNPKASSSVRSHSRRTFRRLVAVEFVYVD